MRSAARIVLLTLLALPRPAGAAVLSEDEFEGESLELGVIGRTFTFVLFGEPLEPPAALEDMNPTATGILDLRLYLQYRSPSLKVVVHNQLLATARSHGQAGGLSIGRGVPPSRWLPLELELADDPTVTLASDADWAYVAYSRGRATLTVGRQPITFGRAKIWKPLDLIGTFAITEVDTEYKPGADALRLDYSPSSDASLTVVAAAGEIDEEDDDFEATRQGSSLLARYKQGWDDGELGGTAGYVRGDAVFGVDGVFDTGSFETYGEATLTLVTSESVPSPEAGSGDLVAKGAAGATFRPSDELTIGPEILYSGFGSTDAGDYLDIALSDRVAVGEQVTLGRLYAAGVANWELHPLVNLGGTALMNVLDPSALLSAGLRYEVAQNAEAYLGGYVPIGRRPEAPLAFEDEYGAFPYFLFFELKAVL